MKFENPELAKKIYFLVLTIPYFVLKWNHVHQNYETPFRQKFLYFWAKRHRKIHVD